MYTHRRELPFCSCARQYPLSTHSTPHSHPKQPVKHHGQHQYVQDDTHRIPRLRLSSRFVEHLHNHVRHCKEPTWNRQPTNEWNSRGELCNGASNSEEGNVPRFQEASLAMNPPGLNLSKTRRANHETFAYLHLTTWGTYKLRLHEYPTAGLDRDTVPRCTPSGIQKTVRTISLGGCRDVWWTAIFPEYSPHTLPSSHLLP